MTETESQCRGTNRHGHQCRRSGHFVHRGFCATHAPKFYLSHQGQIDRGRALFEWWWQAHRGALFTAEELPDWEDANREAQAFWMDGAWRVSQHV